MDDQAPIDALLAEYRKIVGAVKQAAVDLTPNFEPQDALQSATHIMMAMLPSNHCCEIFPDDEEEIDGEGWKKGGIVEDDE